MSHPCTNDPNEVIEKIVEAKANASKFSKFVNGNELETVQLGEGAPTPTIRNVVRLMKSAAAEIDGSDISGKFSTGEDGELKMLDERFGELGRRSVMSLQERLIDRINSESSLASYLHLPDGTIDWGTGGTGSQACAPAGGIMRDPFTEDVFTAFIFNSGNNGQKAIMRRFRWQEITSGTDKTYGWKCIASAVAAWTRPVEGLDASARVWAHQGYGLYRPTEDAPFQFFCGGYGPSGDEAPNWYTLRLVEWDGEDGTEPSVVQTWQLFDPSECRTSNAGGNIRMNVCLSPDMKKLVARGKLIHEDDTEEASYGSYVYRVWDVADLLEMSGDYADASDAYETSVVSPYGSYEADWQGLAFDGRNFYGLFSRGGYSPHLITAWDLDGRIVAERSPAMEGGADQASLRQFEGEGLGIIPNAYGEYDLYLTVSICSSDWGTSKVAAVYNVTHRGVDSKTDKFCLSPLSGSVDDIRHAGFYSAGADSTDGQLSAYGYLMHIGTPNQVNGYAVQLLFQGNDGRYTYIRRAVAWHNEYDAESPDIAWNKPNKPTMTWGSWLRFLVLGADDSINNYHYNLTFVKNTGSGGSYLFKTVFYDLDRGGLAINTNYTVLIDKSGYYSDEDTGETTYHGGQICLQGGDELVRLMDNYLRPETDGTCYLGNGSHKWNAVYAATGTIQTSDERLKANIEAPSDALMRAWGKVNFKVFQMRDAIAEKGQAARLHVGVIAQQVQAAFASEGLDASRYGLFCYDEWGDEYEQEIVVDAEAVLDEDGNVVTPEKTHFEPRVVKKAGDQFSIRYDEALALECAYQRWLGAKREARIAALEAKLASMEG